MSQQATAGQGAGRGSRKKHWYFAQGGGINAVKPHKLAISKIANDTFNTGHNKFAVQFTELQKNGANYLQRSLAAEGYLVAETVQMGKKQTIGLPTAMDENAPDKDNLNIIRNKEMKSMAKRQQKLGELLKKGFATVYEQCSREMKEKLENTKNWEAIQQGAVPPFPDPED
jgi:hypothetical protein